MSAITPYNPATNILFNPNQVSSCSVWLDAQDRKSITFTGTNVNTWKDKSGSGNDATATGNISNIPSINGFNAMAYPGTNSTYFRGSMVNTTSGSVTGFSVMNILPTSFTAIRTISLGVPGSPDYNNSLYTALIEKDSTGTRLNSYRNSADKANATYTAGNPAIACSIYDGASNYFYVNGTAGTTSASTGNFGYSNYEIGSDFGEENLVQYSGYIGEIILFNKISLSTAQRQQVEGYLAWKWNLQKSLPTTHPYYNNPYLSNSYPVSYFPPRLTQTNVVPPGFTIPLTIQQYIYQPTGMALWLDASDKSTITPSSGGTISTWLDKSGNNNNPIFSETNTYNPISNTVYTSGTSYFYSAVDTRKTTVSNMTLFLVHRQRNSSSPTNQGLWGNDIGGGWNRLQLLNFAFTPAQTYSISAGYNAGAGLYYTVSGLNTLNRLLYSCTYSLNTTNGSFVNINGSNSITFTENSAQIETTTQNTYFGTIDTGIDAAVEFYEIILYNSYVSIQQRQQVEGYLAWKWGLNKSLPSDHPYVLFPPG